MNMIALMAAFIAAMVAAPVWAWIVVKTGYELAIVAWAVGGFIGFASYVAGGRGKSMGLACMLLAVLGIFTGKVMAVQQVIDTQTQRIADVLFVAENYEEMKEDAAKYLPTATVEEKKQFMIDREFTENVTAGAISEEEWLAFQEEVIPQLERFQSQTPTLEEWREQGLQEMRDGIRENNSSASLVIESLGVFDAVFVFLGISTAWKVGSGFEDMEE